MVWFLFGSVEVGGTAFRIVMKRIVVLCRVFGDPAHGLVLG
jgi:hypothetical protein